VRDEAERVLRNVGRRIAELRHAKGLTQAELAELARVNPPQIGVIESGRANLTLRSLTKLAALLGVEARDLLDPPKTRMPRRPGRPRKR
jgi:transcriptional regulator with XRE-family HTH domain